MLAADGPNGTDDATRHGAAEAEGIANGKYFLPDNETLGITDLRRRNFTIWNLDHGEIVRRVNAYHLGLVLAFVAGGHLHLARAFNHVVVGQDMTLSVDHKS